MDKVLKHYLVSVIIPAYNLEKYIRGTIESVLHQTYRPIEIIVVDDGSTDKTGEIVLDMSQENSCIKYFKLDRNSGVAAARNFAMNNASGEFLAFLDGDDLWLPTKIEQQISFLKQKNGAFCFTAVEMIDEDGNPLKKQRKIVPEINYNFLLKNTIITTSSVLLDRRLIHDFQMPLNQQYEDYATWLMLLRGGLKAYGINEILVKYRTGRKESLSYSKFKNFKQVWIIQVKYEKISKFASTWNTFFYICNAIKKYGFLYSLRSVFCRGKNNM